MLATVGSYSIRGNYFDVLLTLAFGLIGFLLKKGNSPAAFIYLICMDFCDAFHAFNISTGILKDGNSYYDNIQAVSTDNPDMDVSSWGAWFLNLVPD